MTAFVVSLVLALLMTPLVIWAAHRYELIDVPNERSSHASPVPRGGGIAVATAVLVASLLFATSERDVIALAIGGAILGLTGLVDDRWDLPPGPRLIVQLVVPGTLALVVTDRSGLSLLVVVVIASLGVATYVNAFNFMDGINGIAASQTAVVSLALATMLDDVGAAHLTLAALACAGASLGFLPYNAPKALVFLGDVGSYFLGFWLAGLALFALQLDVPLLVVLSPFLLYLLDTGSTLARRAWRRAPLMEAHREHAYQQLVERGHTHLTVAFVSAFVSATCFALMWAVLDRGWAVHAVAFTGCLLITSAFLAAPSLLSASTKADPEVRT